MLRTLTTIIYRFLPPEGPNVSIHPSCSIFVLGLADFAHVDDTDIEDIQVANTDIAISQYQYYKLCLNAEKLHV